MKVVLTISAVVILLIIVIPVLFSGGRMVKDGVKTAEKIYTPSEMLKKYEYYKNVSATLDRRVADISVYDSELKRIDKKYEGKEMPKWQQEYYNTKNSERLGLINSYNQLASEYNSAMSKFNYAFCNVGELPQGAINPLPKEFKPYIYSSN